jgi:hypothetical protein|tara:strand:+ start:8650 stop:8952 length:303 start_codon:yes stop_codon:yes gene_type:complete
MQAELNQVYTIKIANGDEIVAKITAEDTVSYTVLSPLTVVPGPQGIQMVRSLFTADPDAIITINKTQVSMIAASREEVCDSYIEAITGIKPVRNSKILLG